MLKDELKTALQAQRPTPPAGFDERSDMQILKLTSGEKRTRRMPRAAVVLCVILAIMTLATALAATVDVFNTRLHAFWPEAAEFLMPVNKSCESEGIRMEVLSAVVKGNKAHVTFSLQDLEGDRIDAYTAPSFSELAFPREARPGDPEIPVSEIMPLSFDPETKTGVYAQEFDYDPSLTHEDYEIPLYIQYLIQSRHETKDLHPLLAEYGGHLQTAAVPENARSLMDPDSRPAPGLIPDPAASLHIPLNEMIELSGIGWIDGQLHVQFHYLPDALLREGDVTYSRAFCYAQMQCADGLPAWYRYKDHPEDHNFGWVWDEDGDGFNEWENYIFPCTPEEVQEGTLLALTYFPQETEAIEGNWFVKVPLRMIRFEEPEK